MHIYAAGLVTPCRLVHLYFVDSTTTRTWAGPDWSVTVAETELTASGPSGDVVVVSAGDAGVLRLDRKWFRHRSLWRGNERLLVFGA